MYKFREKTRTIREPFSLALVYENKTHRIIRAFIWEGEWKSFICEKSQSHSFVYVSYDVQVSNGTKSR